MSPMVQRSGCPFELARCEACPTQSTTSLKFQCPLCVPSSCLPQKVATPRKLRDSSHTIIHTLIKVLPVYVSLVCPISYLCIHRILDFIHPVRLQETRWLGRSRDGVVSNPRIRPSSRQADLSRLLTGGNRRFITLDRSTEPGETS